MEWSSSRSELSKDKVSLWKERERGREGESRVPRLTRAGLWILLTFDSRQFQVPFNLTIFKLSSQPDHLRRWQTSGDFSGDSSGDPEPRILLVSYRVGRIQKLEIRTGIQAAWRWPHKLIGRSVNSMSQTLCRFGDRHSVKESVLNCRKERSLSAEKEKCRFKNKFQSGIVSSKFRKFL